MNYTTLQEKLTESIITDVDKLNSLSTYYRDSKKLEHDDGIDVIEHASHLNDTEMLDVMKLDGNLIITDIIFSGEVFLGYLMKYLNGVDFKLARRLLYLNDTVCEYIP